MARENVLSLAKSQLYWQDQRGGFATSTVSRKLICDHDNFVTELSRTGRVRALTFRAIAADSITMARIFRDELGPEAQRTLLAAHGGSAAQAFSDLSGACVRQFFAQNAWAALPEELLSAYTERLWAVVNEAGLPPPLADDEQGEPGEMSKRRAAELAERVMSGLPFPERHEELDTPTRQLLKACLQPEFRRCRDSYCEVEEGVCRRQELSRAKQRISGSHCVDCPYWVALRPDQHAALLKKYWAEASSVPLAQYHEIFLPEKFRALRLFLWRASRHVN